MCLKLNLLKEPCKIDLYFMVITRINTMSLIGILKLSGIFGFKVGSVMYTIVLKNTKLLSR